MSDSLRYQPYYCEENVWHLLQTDALQGEAYAVFITAMESNVPLWAQRAGAMGQPVFWDYHVVAVVQKDGWHVWDLDHVFGAPRTAESYWNITFPQVQEWPPQYQPRFRVVPKELFVESFASDRSHMCGPDGAFLQPPPDWPCIGAGRPSNLVRFLDGSTEGPGVMLDASSFRERFVG